MMAIFVLCSVLALAAIVTPFLFGRTIKIMNPLDEVDEYSGIAAPAEGDC